MLLQRVKMEPQEEAEESPSFRVNVELRYRLGEHSQARLRQLGALCVDEVTIKDQYYDDESFTLAANQVWLSKRNRHWHLILGQWECFNQAHGQAQRESQASPPESAGNLKTNWAGGKADQEIKGDISSKTREGQQKMKVSSSDHLTSGSLTTSAPGLDTDLSYCELTADREIIERLAQCLQIALTAEERRNMTMEAFLKLAGIHHYGSWNVTKKITYKLGETCGVVIERDESSPPRQAAVLTMEADVLNIISELEKMERIATELELEPASSAK
ncbi:hypothetical protein AOXY_G26914 [Acipenser oxyrinchus oxyrinchus]|uniref:CYTH domain-containing protein n=1 Tax=Acipenser oxyrinchus oxyrinchus TaxID=40147 RepID=A0AAD8FXL5_ACIOX|nr:hypothetical protein AOXY_G26914 [Acipenser oxyrinchus oxyrinchus]